MTLFEKVFLLLAEASEDSSMSGILQVELLDTEVLRVWDLDANHVDLRVDRYAE